MNSLMSEVGTTVTSQTDGDWCAVCGEDNACWEPNSCRCYTSQSPTNCHSTFAHQLTLKSVQVALKAQAGVQLNSLNCRDAELTWVEPTDALADAASGEGDAGAPLDHDAKRLWKRAETVNHFSFNRFVLHCNSYFTCLCVCRFRRGKNL